MGDVPKTLNRIIERLGILSTRQLDWLVGVVEQFAQTSERWRNPESDIVTDGVLASFGDALQIHHCFSTEALSKDRFEYAFARALNENGIPATLASRGNPGHDVTIRSQRFSLKTQANREIRPNLLHISKFMELGKGAWTTEADLGGLREQFFRHMKSYDRILQLRRLVDTERIQEYELVEIPKALLSLSETGIIRMANDSSQTPKPGTCRVLDDKGRTLFELYFDGGTERKLQIRKLDKRLCPVHAMWKINRIPLATEAK